MDSYEWRLGAGDVAQRDHDWLLVFVFNLVGQDAPGAVAGGQLGVRILQPAHELLARPSVADELLDRHDRNVVFARNLLQLVATGHTSSVARTDLAEYASRPQPGQSRQVNRCLGVTRTAQDSTLLAEEHEEMPGRHKVPWCRSGVEDRVDGAMAFLWTDARTTALMVDGNRERCRRARGVALDHPLEALLASEVGEDRHAQQSGAFAGHEGDHLRRNLLGRADEVALVLAVLCVDHNHDAALANRFDGPLHTQTAALHLSSTNLPRDARGNSRSDRS